MWSNHVSANSTTYIGPYESFSPILRNHVYRVWFEALNWSSTYQSPPTFSIFGTVCVKNVTPNTKKWSCFYDFYYVYYLVQKIYFLFVWFLYPFAARNLEALWKCCSVGAMYCFWCPYFQFTVDWFTMNSSLYPITYLVDLLINVEMLPAGICCYSILFSLAKA